MSVELLYKVAYDEAVRALSEQQAEVESFRTRAGMVLSAAAITTSFLGAQALQRGHSSFFAWLALIAFGGVAALSLALLWPYVWQVTMDPLRVVEIHVDSEHPAALEALHRELIHNLHTGYLRNREGLDFLAVLLQIASGMLALEIAIWMMSLVLTP